MFFLQQNVQNYLNGFTQISGVKLAWKLRNHGKFSSLEEQSREVTKTALKNKKIIVQMTTVNLEMS